MEKNETIKKAKTTLFEKLGKRKYKITKKPVYWFYKTVMVDHVAKNYNIQYNIIDDIRKEEGPAIIIFNHLSRIDHAYVLGAIYPRRFNMLAGYNEFFRKHLHFVFKLDNCIPKKNYTTEIGPMKAISSILKQGGTVAFAPEGLASDIGCNKPIVPGTGKMLKHYKVPVYFLHLEGNYLQNTKVCLDERYGKTFATLSKLFTPEDLKNKTGEEIDDIINEKFRSNEYAWNKEKQIKWDTKGRICYKLEDMLYKCPKCGCEFTMHGEGDKFECKNCGNGATMDDFYQWHPYENSVIPENPVEWFNWQRQQVIKEIRENPNYEFKEHVKIGNLDPYKWVPKKQSSFIVGEGELTINHSGMHYEGTRNGKDYKFDLGWNVLYTFFTVLDASFFSTYVDGEYFDIYPSRPAYGKISLLVEEMHRYHVNFYKNFKWNDYMYEGYELGIDAKEDKQ